MSAPVWKYFCSLCSQVLFVWICKLWMVCYCWIFDVFYLILRTRSWSAFLLNLRTMGQGCLNGIYLLYIDSGSSSDASMPTQVSRAWICNYIPHNTELQLFINALDTCFTLRNPKLEGRRFNVKSRGIARLNWCKRKMVIFIGDYIIKFVCLFFISHDLSRLRWYR